jgi:uncharacterized RDD family membrane protein YckC
MDWHYADAGQQIGPVTEQRLLELASAGSVTPDTLVWHPGMAEWKPFREAGPSVPPPLNGNGSNRYCSSCGRSFPATDLAMYGESAICMECKPAWVQRLRQGMVSTNVAALNYAGFWIRFGAVCIDALALGAVQGVLFFLFFGGTITSLVSQAAQGQNPDELSGAFAGAFAAGIGMFQLVSFLLGVAYHWFLWFRYGATLGQMALGLKVVKPDGSAITSGQAVGRYFGYILSSLILCIGFMMAGWDDQKRALHDRLANTRVIRTR